MSYFQSPAAAKAYIRELFGEALLKWGNSVPIRFRETTDDWDFEVVISHNDNCNSAGCTLARAFFPDPGRHELVLFPKLLGQPEEEQLETMIHELGHVFGLRHFFADVSETAWPSVVFGAHKPFSIMNYGTQSKLTEEDKEDLRKVYAKAWSGELDAVNGTRIQFVRPYHTLINNDFDKFQFNQLAAVRGNRPRCCCC